MAVWLARPPASVAKPRTRRGIQAGRLAGREVLGQDQRGGRQLVLERLGALADQLAEDPGLDVADVGGARRQVRIGQPFQATRVHLEHLDDGVLGGDPLALDPGMGIGAQRRVGDHPGMSREDIGILGSEPLPGIRPRLLGLAPGRVQAAIEPGQLGGDGLRRDLRGAATACPAGRAPPPARSRSPD